MNKDEDIVIHCARGVSAHLLELHQSSTYRGLLDGGPNQEINEMLLGITEHATGSIPTHLVRPTETPVPGVRRLSPYGPRLQLPRLECRGLFESGTHWLWIVWFQEDAGTEAELRSIDFLGLAKDEVSQW